MGDILRNTVSVEKFLTGITGMADHTKERKYIYVWTNKNVEIYEIYKSQERAKKMLGGY